MPRQRSIPLHTRHRPRNRRREPLRESPAEQLSGVELIGGPWSNEAVRMIDSYARRPQHAGIKQGITRSLGLINQSVTEQGNTIHHCEVRLGRYNRRKVLSSRVEAVRDRIRSHVERLQEDSQRRVERSEDLVRRLVDFEVALRDRDAVRKEVANSVENRGPASGSVADEISKRLEMLERQTGGKSMLERYGNAAPYVEFKNRWHEAMHDDSAILPPPKRWFNEAGEAVWAFNSDNFSDDDDVVVAREITSLKCPLLLTIMEEPYGNTKCKHSFEKEAILEYLNGHTKECPQFGCSKSFGPQDLFPDEKLARRIARFRRQDTLDTDHDITGIQPVDSEDSDGDIPLKDESEDRTLRGSTELDESSWR